MSGIEFIPNCPPKRSLTATLVTPAQLVDQNIVEVTRFASGVSVPTLGLQQHQVLEKFRDFLQNHSCVFRNLSFTS
jgi:hypothetical protein